MGFIALANLSAADMKTLPDPLVSSNGTRIATPQQWEALRRPEILELFRTRVYGRNPVERPKSLSFEVVKDESALNGTARKKVVMIRYEGPGGKGAIAVTLYIPKTKPKGVFLLIVNRSRRIIDDAEGNRTEFWPVAQILARGYATAAFHNSDADPDEDDGFKNGVHGIFDPPGQPRPDDAWGTIAAWAWATSRVIDYLETDPDLKSLPIAVVGHSRGGKTALWCGAQDPRVALTISNESGNTGAALSRQATGEKIARINTHFPHWFAKNYRQYNDNEDALPVDQHMLLALLAPRLVYVASAEDDAHSSPRAEFESCVLAGPVFELYGLKGVGSAQPPVPGSALQNGAIGYHLRKGGHNLTVEDWNLFLDYTDRHWTP